MGLFSKKQSEEEVKAKEANRDILEKFNPTASWGVKKYQPSKQFMYDEDKSAFVVVDGPDETFRERNPFVIGFDEVNDVFLEVDEWWTDDGKKFNTFHNPKVLLQQDYSKVFWHYDFYLNITTSHPFCENIRYRMNFNTNILKIPGFHLFVQRGLELNGIYRGAEIREQRIRLEEFCEKIKGNVKKEHIFDTLTGQRSDSILGKLANDMTEDWYISRIEKVISHVKRAGRISKLLMK